MFYFFNQLKQSSNKNSWPSNNVSKIFLFLLFATMWKNTQNSPDSYFLWNQKVIHSNILKVTYSYERVCY